MTTYLQGHHRSATGFLPASVDSPRERIRVSTLRSISVIVQLTVVEDGFRLLTLGPEVFSPILNEICSPFLGGAQRRSVSTLRILNVDLSD